jgi:hypothetical protein
MDLDTNDDHFLFFDITDALRDKSVEGPLVGLLLRWAEADDNNVNKLDVVTTDVVDPHVQSYMPRLIVLSPHEDTVTTQ